MSGLIPPGKNAAEKTAYMKKLTGHLPDGQSALFNEDDSEEIRENRKVKERSS